MVKRYIHFPNRRWNTKIVWRRSGSRNIHFNPGSPWTRRRTRNSSRKIRGVSISRLIDGWWWSKKRFLVHFRELHSPSSRWTESQTVRAERRIIPNSNTIHLPNQSNKFDFVCDAWTSHRRLLEISKETETYHTLHLTGRKTSRVNMVRGGAWRRNKRHTAPITCGQRWPPIQRRKKWVSRRNVFSLLINCCEMSVFGSYWETWYFVVCERACACHNKVDKACHKRLARLISYIHHTSGHRQNPLCRKHSTTMQNRTVSGLWLCRAQQCRLGLFRGSGFAGDLEDSRSTSGGILMHFGRSHVCANRLDVQETNFGFTQFYRSMQVHAWTVFPLSLSGIWWVKHFIPCRTEQMDPRESHGAHQRRSNKHWSHSIKYNAFWIQCCVVCLWGRWGSNQNDFQGN